VYETAPEHGKVTSTIKKDHEIRIYRHTTKALMFKQAFNQTTLFDRWKAFTQWHAYTQQREK
jgi:hypothetical protein